MKTNIKLFFFLFAFIGGFQYAVAVPTTSAPLPSHAAEDVLSLYSNAYSNAGNGLVNPGSWANFPLEETVQDNANDKVLKVTGQHLCYTTNWNPGGKEFIHMDVYWESGTVGAISFKIGLGYNADYLFTIADFAWPVLVQGQWISIDVPTQLWINAGYTDADINAIGVLQIQATGTLYIDNIYAYGTRQGSGGGNIPAAPTPTQQASDVVSVFSNHYTATTNFIPLTGTSSTAVISTINGNDQVAKIPSGECPIAIDTWSIANKGIIHVDVYYEDGGTGVIFYGFSNSSNSNPMRYPSSRTETRKGQWVSIEVSTDEFKNAGLDLDNILVMRLRTNGTFYIDNVYAYGNPGDEPGAGVGEPEFPAVAISRAPLPQQLPENVISIFSDRYVTASKFVPLTSNTVEFFTIQGTNDKVAKLPDLSDSPVDIATWNIPADATIHLDVYYEDGGTGVFSLELADDVSDISQYAPAGYTFPNTQQGEWVGVEIPVAYFITAGLGSDHVKVVHFKGSGTFYIDNLYAYTLPSVSDVFEVRTQFGVNLSGGEFDYMALYPDNPADWAYYAEKGLNLIRLPFKWERLQATPGGDLVTADLNKLKQAVAFAQGNGMQVMLDAHNYGRGNFSSLGGEYRVGEVPLTVAFFADFWKKMALEFKDYPNIWGYDLVNEPHDMEPYDWGATAQAVINAIREVDMNTPIVIEGNNWASADTWVSSSSSLGTLTDPAGKIIYQAHCYFDADASGAYRGGYQGEIGSDSQRAITRLSHFVNWLKSNNKIGIVGEMGCPGNDSRYLTMLDGACAYLKANDVSMTYWAGGRYWPSTYTLAIHPDVYDMTMEKPQMTILEKYGDFYVPPLATSVEELTESHSISLFPNPVKDRLKINSSVSLKSIEVYNLFGQLLIGDVAGNAASGYEIDLSALPKGHYIIKIQSEDNSISLQKIIKL